jgi:hypothetical protein
LGTFFGGAKKVPRAKRSNRLKNGMNVQGAKPYGARKYALVFR